MIDHLNDVPEWLVEEARRLPDEDAARALLMARVSPDCWIYLTPFIEEVVLGREPAKLWLRGQVVVPDFSLADVVTLPRSALLVPIGGEPWHRVVPSLDDWLSNASWVGAPACVSPEADYRFSPPADSIALGRAPTEEVEDGDVAVRRWIAARLARVVPEGRDIRSPEAFTAILDLPETAAWTDDSLRAAEGLIREYREMSDAMDSIPGMRGPDEWYA